MMKEKNYRSKRVVSVCIPCKRKKLKCDKARPHCSRCQRVGRQCFYDGNGTSLTPPDEANVGTASLNDNAGIPSVGSSTSAVSTVSGSSVGGGSLDNHIAHRISPASSVGNTVGYNKILAPDTNIRRASSSINNTVTSSNSSDRFGEVIEDHGDDTLTNVPLSLWDPNDMIVTYGSTTYFDIPFGSHALIQYDPYTRLLCGALHGGTLYDLQARLNVISNENGSNMSTDSRNKDTYQVGPLTFIEKAIIKWVEKTNEYVKNQLPLDYFNTIYTIEDTMHPNLLSSIQMIIREIEVLMISREQVNYYLKNFYENIYPFFPFIEITIFERKLKEILIDKTGDHYEINVFDQNIRIKLETLCTFLLILAISLRSSTLTPDERNLQINKRDIADIATQLIVYAQKILSLLNGFKFTNENILCATLYLFVAEFLHPENRSIHSSHDEVLTLNCLSNLANTLGLFNDPAKFVRYHNNPGYSTEIDLFKRKLWIGLQSLRLQTCTIDGYANDMDIKYLETFIDGSKEQLSIFNGMFKGSSMFDFKLSAIQEDVYIFHIQLSKLMSLCSSVNKEQNLDSIVTSMKNISELLNNKFPLTDLVEIENGSNEYQENLWRNAVLNLDSVRNFNTINMNIVGLSSLMSISMALSIYFEKLSIKESGKYQRYYHSFMLDTLTYYSKLLQTIVDYLNGSLSKYILKKHEFSINKSVIYTLIKIWRTQMSFALRFSYKYELRSSGKDHKDPESNTISDEIYDEYILKIIKIFHEHLKVTADLSTLVLEESYIGAYQAVQMIRYLIYLMNNGILTRAIDKFWNKIYNSNTIPERIIEKINSKWGAGPKTVDLIKHYLLNPEVLKNISFEFMERIDDVLAGITIKNEMHNNDTTSSAIDFSQMNLPPENQQDILNQFLESNFDLFINVIDDNMGELPTI